MRSGQAPRRGCRPDCAPRRPSRRAGRSGCAARHRSARHLLALDDARRIRAGSDRARPAMLRVAVRVRTAAEAPALHHALEAATLRRAGHLHRARRREDADVDRCRRRCSAGISTLALPGSSSRMLRITRGAASSPAFFACPSSALFARRPRGVRSPFAYSRDACAACPSRAARRLQRRRVRAPRAPCWARPRSPSRDLLPRSLNTGSSQLLADDADHVDPLRVTAELSWTVDLAVTRVATCWSPGTRAVTLR